MFEKIGSIALVRRPVAVRAPIETRSETARPQTSLDALEAFFFAQVPGAGESRA